MTSPSTWRSRAICAWSTSRPAWKSSAHSPTHRMTKDAIAGRIRRLLGDGRQAGV